MTENQLNPLGHKAIRIILVMDDNTAYDAKIDEPMDKIGLSTYMTGVDDKGNARVESTLTLRVTSHNLRAVVLKEGDLPDEFPAAPVKMIGSGE